MIVTLKKIILSALIACIPALFSCNRVRPQITGNLVGLQDGWVWLYRYDDRALVKQDSAYSSGGRFRIPQPDALPDIAFVNFETAPDLYVPLLTDGPQVYVSGNLNYRGNVRVSGTEGNEKLRDYIRSIRDVDIMARTIELQIGRWEQDSVAVDSAEYAMLLGKRDQLRRKLALARENFITENPSSVVSAMFLGMALNDSMSYSAVDSLIHRLDSAIVDNAFSRRLQMRLDELAN